MSDDSKQHKSDRAENAGDGADHKSLEGRGVNEARQAGAGEMSAVEKRRTNRSSGSLAEQQEHSIELRMDDGKIESRRERAIQPTPADTSGHVLKAGLVYSEEPIKNKGVQNLDDVEQKLRGVATGFGESITESLGGLAKDPNATNKAMMENLHKAGEAVKYVADQLAHGNMGKLSDDAAKIAQKIVDASDKYSAMSQYEQGRVIGKEVMPNFVPDLPEVAKELRAAQKAEGVYYYEKPHGKPSPEGKTLAGKGGEWPVLNERAASDVVRQTHDESCVSACGEMISKGRLKEGQLMSHLGTPADVLELAKHLGPEWTSGTLDLTVPNALIQRSPFVVTLRDHNTNIRRIGQSHAVVVDGIDEAGNFKIRDPQDGTKYEMTRKDFEHHWTGEAVYRRKI